MALSFPLQNPLMMLAFAKLLPTVLFALILLPITSATPWPQTFKPTTHRIHHIVADRSVKLETFHPESTFKGYGVDGVDPFPSYRRYPRDTPDTGDIAVSFLASKLSVSEDSIHLRTSAQGQAAHHVFLAQKINGVPVANAVANVAFNNNGKVSSFGSSFVKQSGAAAVDPSVSLGDAIATAEKGLHGTYNGHPTTLEYVVQPDGFAALTYVIQIQNEATGTWYEAFVDAHSNTLLSATDFVAKASYRAVPFPADDPAMNFQVITDPQNLAASPNGWHQEFETVINATAGNNAIAYNGSQIIYIPSATSSVLNFNYIEDLKKDPTIGSNVPAAITNAFYVVNCFHDFAYRYGFTETTFNFQTNNFGKGGEEFDRVLVSVQDIIGTDDTKFAIPPDGQSGKMQLLLYVQVDFTPRRDSSLQNQLIIHESQHGANQRMTGGGTARCFQTLEANAIDEGYADAVADTISQTQNISDFVFGKALSDSPTGFRKHAYSTSNITNPLNYSSLNGMTDAYDMGEVWANTLHNMYAALVAAHGWDLITTADPAGTMGNVVFFHLLFDALLLHPCPPTFLTTRDAWIQADANRYGGANKCVLWQTFASKGFGVNATNYVNDDNIPPECLC